MVEQDENDVICSICQKQLSFANASVGPLKSDGTQEFFCSLHFWSTELLVRSIIMIRLRKGT